ncbi:MAG: family 2 glycosyl transferase [Bacteroidetes bacterium]|nr:MAG: family 2 glycosyl transferase [Bacteroidota bacterium]
MGRLSIYIEWALALVTMTVYGLVMLRLVWMWLRAKKGTEEVSAPVFVTIIIPVRNESANMERCLESAMSQDYPEDLLEVIVVDDFSEDETCRVASETAARKKFRNFRLLRLSENGETSGKKAAISYGVEQARGSVIVTTDADCIAGPKWIRSLAAHFENGKVDFVIAPVLLENEKYFFDYLQGLEITGLALVTGAAAASGKPILCNGANLAYTKDVFHRVGGYTGDGLASGDDVLLLQRILEKQAGKVAYAGSPDAVVYTSAQKNLRAFFQQRRRWVSKFSALRSLPLRVTAAIVFATNLLVLAGPVLAFFFHGFILPYLLLVVIKSAIDFLFLSLAALYFRKPRLLHFFIPAQLLYSIYLVTATLGGLTGRYTWKGRSSRKK